MRPSIFVTNLGAWLFSICSMLGANSCHRLIPASFPTIEPKSPNGSVIDLLQYGRDAVSAATEVSARRKYETFSRPFPVPSRVTKTRAAACVARPVKLSLFELLDFAPPEGRRRYLLKILSAALWLDIALSAAANSP
jgi:hypothetical protein